MEIEGAKEPVSLPDPLPLAFETKKDDLWRGMEQL
jgi:hypothetical protein